MQRERIPNDSNNYNTQTAGDSSQIKRPLRPHVSSSLAPRGRPLQAEEGEQRHRISSIVSAGFASKQGYSTNAAGVYNKSSDKPVGLSQSNFQRKRSSVRDSGSVYRADEGSGRNLNDLSSTTAKKKYQMDKKSTQTELVIANKDLKFITVNMLNMNLKSLNLSGNKIQTLPTEICDLVNLEELSIFKNYVNKLP